MIFDIIVSPKEHVNVADLNIFSLVLAFQNFGSVSVWQHVKRKLPTSFYDCSLLNVNAGSDLVLRQGFSGVAKRRANDPPLGIVTPPLRAFDPPPHTQPNLFNFLKRYL